MKHLAGVSWTPAKSFADARLPGHRAGSPASPRREDKPMSQRRPESDDLALPADLVAFLAAGQQLAYDPTPCEAGAVTLLPLAELKQERFPVETSGSPFFAQDPHYPDVKSYLVLGVNLVASCTGGYDPVGLLLWLPVEKRYGVWDSSHCKIQMFGPEVTWERIAAAPVQHLNAGWTGIDPEAPPMEDLRPWPAHPYGSEQVYVPQPVE
jgi:hypothetical protein